MAIVSANSTKISLQTFMGITDSRGQFETWADLIKAKPQSFFINGEILTNVLQSPIQQATEYAGAYGGNVEFAWKQNKDISQFIDDVTKRNSNATLDKAIMKIGGPETLRMVSFKLDKIDSRTAVEWSKYISEELATCYQAKQDYQNMVMIEKAMLVAVAMGRVKTFANAKKLEALTSDEWKRVGAKLSNIFVENRKLRNANFKGYDKSLETHIIDSTFSNNLLSGLTTSQSAPAAYTDIQLKYGISQMFGETFYTSLMYLGQKILQSEFKTENNSILINPNTHTGQTIKPFHFENLVLLNIFKPSVLYYEQEIISDTKPLLPTRLSDIIQFIWSINCAMDPKLSIVNFAVFDAPLNIGSYTEIDGTVVPAMDLNTKDGYDKLCIKLFNEQPQLYQYINDIKGKPLNGSATTASDEDVKAMWKKAAITVK